jgi:hypothetical protein
LSNVKNAEERTDASKERQGNTSMSDGMNKRLNRQFLILSIIELMVFLGIVIGALCWTLIIVEGIQVAQDYGFVIKGNFVHAFGSLFILLFLILFPLNYMLRRSDAYFGRARREIWRKS